MFHNLWRKVTMLRARTWSVICRPSQRERLVPLLVACRLQHDGLDSIPISAKPSTDEPVALRPQQLLELGIGTHASDKTRREIDSQSGRDHERWGPSSAIQRPPCLQDNDLDSTMTEPPRAMRPAALAGFMMGKLTSFPSPSDAGARLRGL